GVGEVDRVLARLGGDVVAGEGEVAAGVGFDVDRRPGAGAAAFGFVLGFFALFLGFFADFFGLFAGFFGAFFRFLSDSCGAGFGFAGAVGATAGDERQRGEEEGEQGDQLLHVFPFPLQDWVSDSIPGT